MPMNSNQATQLKTQLGILFYSITMLFAVACNGPKYPNCDKDENCREGEFCVNKTCQQCRSNDDCTSGQICNGGRCEAPAAQAECTSDAACPGGGRCVSGRCTGGNQTSTETGSSDCALQNVYFDFDSSDLSAGTRNALEANARCIQQKGLSVALVGHTDPRGTEEYNLALGDKRATEAKNYLIQLGVDGSKITSTSHGEEQASGDDESGWIQDRRVDIMQQ